MIRFRLDPLAAERLAFAYSPLVESVMSLHVLAQPKHHPLQHLWVRKMRGLSAPLRRRIATFSFLFDSYIAVPLLTPPTGGYASFEEELEVLRAFDDELKLASELTAPFALPPFPRRPNWLDDVEMRELLFAEAARRGSEVRALAELATEDPRAVLQCVCDLLRDYWEEAFRDEWARIEPLLAQSVQVAGETIATSGIYAFLASLRAEIRVDASKGEFWLERRHEHELEIGPNEALVMTPSVYIWPHVRVNCDGPGPLGIAYPAPFVAQEAGPRVPPEDLVRVLKAFAHDTRLRALQRIAERPRSTQELAPLVGVSEAALSEHLRTLAAAGILTSRREGYYVLYSLAHDRVLALSESLADFLRLPDDATP